MLAAQRAVVRLSKPPRRWKVPSFPPLMQGAVRNLRATAIQKSTGSSGGGGGGGGSSSGAGGRGSGNSSGGAGRAGTEGGSTDGDGMASGAGGGSSVSMGRGWKLPMSGGLGSVEDVAMEMYLQCTLPATLAVLPKGHEWRGMHAENGVWLTIASLLVWDVQWPHCTAAASPPPPAAVQAEVVGAHGEAGIAAPPPPTTPRYADTPHTTLMLPGSERHTALQQRFRVLQQAGEAERILRAAWRQYNGVHSYGVDWARLDVEDLAAIVAGVNGQTIAAVVQALVLNPQEWTGGLPDLLFWTRGTDSTVSGGGGGGGGGGSDVGGGGGGSSGGSSGLVPRTVLVEVKGPGDKLSDRQHAWIARLAACGTDIHVAYVSAK